MLYPFPLKFREHWASGSEGTVRGKSQRTTAKQCPWVWRQLCWLNKTNTRSSRPTFLHGIDVPTSLNPNPRSYWYLIAIARESQFSSRSLPVVAYPSSRVSTCIQTVLTRLSEKEEKWNWKGFWEEVRRIVSGVYDINTFYSWRKLQKNFKKQKLVERVTETVPASK